MEINEIKDFINNNIDNPEVCKLVDSLADKRVNMARAKWEAELPGLIQNGVNDQIETEKQNREKAELLTGKFNNLLEAEGVKPELAEPFLPDFGALVDDEQSEPKMAEIVQRAKEYQQRVLHAKYAGSPPKGGGGSLPTQDPAATEFRKAMGLKT